MGYPLDSCNRRCLVDWQPSLLDTIFILIIVLPAGVVLWTWVGLS
ncbi:hypothetical protein ACVWYU_001716 [Pseudomonas sp. TE12234]